MKSFLTTCLLITLNFNASFGQTLEKDVIFIVDELRTEWDLEAENLETYVGMKDYCHSKSYRRKIVKLLDLIHHYDTSIYFAVTAMYDTNEDAAAKETLDDIMIIEKKYTNRNLVSFLKTECDKVITIEKNLAKKDSGGFDKDIESLEEELLFYIDAITLRVDLVDEHIHHLKGFDKQE